MEEQLDIERLRAAMGDVILDETDLTGAYIRFHGKPSGPFEGLPDELIDKLIEALKPPATK